MLVTHIRYILTCSQNKKISFSSPKCQWLEIALYKFRIKLTRKLITNLGRMKLLPLVYISQLLLCFGNGRFMKVLDFEKNKFLRDKFSYALINETSIKSGLDHFIMCLSLFNMQPDGSIIFTINDQNGSPYISIT